MLELEFMRLALATGALVGLLAPAVGFFLVERKASLIGDGLGHVAFAGVAIGYLLGISPVLTALVAAQGLHLLMSMVCATLERANANILATAGACLK